MPTSQRLVDHMTTQEDRASEDQDAHPAHPDLEAAPLAATVVVLDVGKGLLLRKIGIIDLAEAPINVPGLRRLVLGLRVG
jgi:hypothetical protein